MNIIIGWILKSLGLLVAAGAVMVGTKIYKMKHDSVIEEVIEEKIKDETGIEIDLTSDSPEDDDASKE